MNILSIKGCKTLKGAKPRLMEIGNSKKRKKRKELKEWENEEEKERQWEREREGRAGEEDGNKRN